MTKPLGKNKSEIVERPKIIRVVCLDSERSGLDFQRIWSFRLRVPQHHLQLHAHSHRQQRGQAQTAHRLGKLLHSQPGTIENLVFFLKILKLNFSPLHL